MATAHLSIRSCLELTLSCVVGCLSAHSCLASGSFLSDFVLGPHESVTVGMNVTLIGLDI